MRPQQIVPQQIVWHGPPVNSWAQFHRVVKSPDRLLLARLDEYRNSVLVAGCQRSGTTAVTRLLKRTDELVDCAFGHDDELDGALLLAGYVERFASGRHCFQTTYLNDRYPEYFDHRDFKLVWILREPRAVVHSMLRNWKRGALNRLYDACSREAVPGIARRRTVVSELFGRSLLDKACASYVAKTKQTSLLRAMLGDRMLIVDYDDLVVHRERLLPKICEFAEVPFRRELLGHLHGKSVCNGSRLSRRQATAVEATCVPVYESARSLRTAGGEHGDG